MVNIKEKSDIRYMDACRCLSPRLFSALSAVPINIQIKAQEIRLKVNKPSAVYCGDQQYFFTENGCVTEMITDQPMLVSNQKDICDTFQTICNYSVYSRQNEIKNGYVTVKGGLRAGLCGTAVLSQSNEITNIRDISSINLRIAREIKGCASLLVNNFNRDKGGMLICGAPCSGKTTVLRDLARQLSNQFCYHVSVVDSRGELAGTTQGIAQNDLGLCDVLDGYPKSTGISQAIRVLSPDVIICDEIGTEEDVKAVEQSVNSGICMIATMHASSMEELLAKQYGVSLMRTGAFSKICFLWGRDRAGAIRQVENYVL